MAETRQLTVTAEDTGNRLDQFLSKCYPQRTRSYFNKLIKQQYVLINGNKTKSGYLLKEGDDLTVTFHQDTTNLDPVDIPLDIVFEDDDILVVNKAAGMTVHPGKGTSPDTLVNALLHHSGKLSSGGSLERPGIVHRLDKYTSGLLVVAKNDFSHHKLRAQFDQKTIHRIYWALAWGKFENPEGIIHTNIDRSKKDPTKYVVARSGREAITHFRILENFEYASLVQLKLETGRTHQIRVHLNFAHHPIIGDPDYNGRDSRIKQLPPHLQKRGNHLIKLLQHQALHAKELSFIHPRTDEVVRFESKLPAEMAQALEKLPQLFLLQEY